MPRCSRRWRRSPSSSLGSVSWWFLWWRSPSDGKGTRRKPFSLRAVLPSASWSSPWLGLSTWPCTGRTLNRKTIGGFGRTCQQFTWNRKQIGSNQQHHPIRSPLRGLLKGEPERSAGKRNRKEINRKGRQGTQRKTPEPLRSSADSAVRTPAGIDRVERGSEPAVGPYALPRAGQRSRWAREAI